MSIIKKIDMNAYERTFPDNFDKQNVETEEVEAPQRTAGNVVAPVNRSAKKPRKVQLTSSQIALANDLDLPLNNMRNNY